MDRSKPSPRSARAGMGSAKRGKHAIFGALLASVALACGGGTELSDGGARVDAEAADGGTPDAGTPEAGVLDAGTNDAGTNDAGDTDAGDTDAASDAGGTDAGALAPTRADLAAAVVIDGVALYQAVQVMLRANSVDQSTEVPIIAGRDALVRIYPESLPAYDGRPLNVVVEISDGGSTRRVGLEGFAVSAISFDGDPTSFADIRVPGAWITETSSLQIRIEDPSGGDGSADAAWPAAGPAVLGAQSDLGGITVVLVPFRYDTDGSARLPDTSPAVLDTIEAIFTSLYPYTAVDLRVHDPVGWAEPLRYNDNVDWGEVNNAIGDLRDDEGAPEWEYWYGLMAPADTRAAYCAGVAWYASCVTGQSWTATVTGTRDGSGVWYPGTASVFTLAHEVGHQHGLGHAPCNTSGESSYPYSGGGVGVPGWDTHTGTFFPSAGYADFMGYCSDQWISDHNFQRLHQRNVDLHAAYSIPSSLGVALPQPLSFFRVEAGVVTSRHLHVRRQLPGEVIPLTWLDAAGVPLDEDEAGKLVPSHDASVTYALPAPPPGAARARVDGLELPL